MRTSRPPAATISLVAVTVAALIAAGLAPWARVAATTTATSDAWPDDAVVYHVVVDRFADADAPDTQVGGGVDDLATALTDWMGGDLDGVRLRLDHIVATGANTIWLSPVSPGPYYHGYHSTDLTDVDDRFGDVDALRALVRDAHERGLRVIYDLVLNHTSDRHPWFVAAQADCDTSPFVAYYRFRDCPDDYAAFANLGELPQLDLDHPPLRAHLVDEVLPFWLDDIGVDGVRLDHVQGPSREAVAALRARTDERWPGTLLLGEVWASQPIIDTYADVLDAATAFPLRDRLVAVFARGGDVRAVSQPLAALVAADAQGQTPRPATYLSSHDQPRFTHVADGDTRRTALAYAAILTLPGLPVIYAGDEVGQSQSSSLPDDADHADRWYREPMPWDTDDWDHAVHDRIAALARLRTTTPALHDDASYRELVGAGPVWVYERRSADGSDRLLVALNTSDESATLTLAELGVTASSPPGVDDAGDGSGVARPLTDADVEVVHGSPTSLGDGPGVPVGLGALEVLVLRLPVG